jgi:hypothetical protein
LTTTALFAEILIIGVLSLVWVGLSLVCIGIRPNHLAVLKGWELLFGVGFIALAYSVGIGMDRLADKCQDRLTKWLWRRHRPTGESPALSEAEVRLRVIQKAPAAAVAFLDYARSRRRITRALVLNGLLTSVVGTVLVFRGSWIPQLAALVLAIGAVTLAILSVWTWYDLGIMYHRRLRQSYRIFVLGRPAPITDVVEPHGW